MLMGGWTRGAVAGSVGGRYAEGMLAATSGISQVIRQRIDVAALIPERYAAYRELVVAGLIYFLERLPAHRLGAIVAEQAALPATATAAHRLVELMHHCATLHKLGQVLARDRRLDAGLRGQLQRLESIVPRTPVSSALAAIRHDLPDLEGQGVRVGGEVLAEASVAVVVPIEWHQADSGAVTRGVLKVLKPGIAERLNDELTIWGGLGDFLDEESTRRGLPELNFRETLDSVRELLASEVDLRGEQRNLAVAQKMYGMVPGMAIPRLLPFCSARITAMERIDGRKVTELDGSETGLREGIAETIVRGLLAQVIWNQESEALFHADPHAGNLCVTEDGRLGVYDWSLTATLSKRGRVLITRMVVGALMDSAAMVAAAVEDLATGAVDRERLRAVVGKAVDELRGRSLPTLAWLTRLLDRCVVEGGVRFEANLLLFRKTLHSLQGVLADVDPQFEVDRVLLREVIARYGREWPMRAFALPWDHSFATHVSNAEVQGLMMTLPFMAGRAWLEQFSRGVRREAQSV